MSDHHENHGQKKGCGGHGAGGCGCGRSATTGGCGSGHDHGHSHGVQSSESSGCCGSHGKNEIAHQRPLEVRAPMGGCCSMDHETQSHHHHDEDSSDECCGGGGCGGDEDHGDDHHGGHILVPLINYIGVWLALLALTVITVAISYVDFGTMNMVIAMIVASVKAALVMSIFMGLKYEGKENTVTILSSALFLLIFIGLTSADVFFRENYTPIPEDKSLPPRVSTEKVDTARLVAGGDDLKNHGAQVFAQNCATCHGTDGMGNGPAAAALNPKPRNFHSGEGWKNGRKITSIFKTITQGIPGSPMGAFAGIKIEDRFALAHYVQSLGPSVEKDTPEDIASLGLDSPQNQVPELSIEEAMDQVAKAPISGDLPSENQAYRYSPGVMPRGSLCALPVNVRPRSCEVNSSQPAAPEL